MSRHKRKPLYNRKGLTVNGQAFAKEFGTAIRPIIQRWMSRKGYARESVFSSASIQLAYEITLESLNQRTEVRHEAARKGERNRSRGPAPHKHVAAPSRQSKSD